MSIAKAVALLNKLATVQPEENPTIASILSECPELPHNDWINRYGPASEWSEIAAHYRTPVLAWLIKVLVTAERELRWIGGSVAAPIWLFRDYQKRFDAVVDPLAEWILRNKGNDYLPFGSMSVARSLDEWRRDQAERANRWTAHVGRQQGEVDAKAARLVARQEKVIQRKQTAQARKKEIERIIKRLEALAPEARLVVIANEKTVPLGALPNAVVSSLIEAVQQSTSENRKRLLRLIDRRQSGPWKGLRKRLEESK